MGEDYKIFLIYTSSGKKELIESGDVNNSRRDELMRDAEFLLKNGYGYIDFRIKDGELTSLAY